MKSTRKVKSSISKASSYREIGRYWDRHSLAPIWDRTRPVEFTVDLQGEMTYFPLKTSLASKVRAVAKRRGVSAATLLNSWVREKLS